MGKYKGRFLESRKGRPGGASHAPIYMFYSVFFLFLTFMGGVSCVEVIDEILLCICVVYGFSKSKENLGKLVKYMMFLESRKGRLG